MRRTITVSSGVLVPIPFISRSKNGVSTRDNRCPVRFDLAILDSFTTCGDLAQPLSFNGSSDFIHLYEYIRRDLTYRDYVISSATPAHWRSVAATKERSRVNRRRWRQ